MSNGAGHCALFRRKRDLADGLMGAEDEAARAGLVSTVDGSMLDAVLRSGRGPANELRERERREAWPCRPSANLEDDGP
jgi:hypothetical protein